MEGTNLFQNETYTLGVGGKLNLLQGKYEHCIYFKKQIISADQDEPKYLKEGKELHRKRRSEPLEDNLPVKRQKTEENESIIEEGKKSKNDNGGIISSGKEKNKFKSLISSQWDEIESGKLLIYRTEGLLPRDQVFYSEYSSLT